ncbi:hypothetical protein EG328_001207 [Venturia inaequalis]|uniref:BZIP transcription factor n=1 Tax=Venturia inaequalis TaxID=5025 RepID=A0A8H3Z0P3_VENIN|nr:hypothetical protein EG328_001207 [Venturia inaequalis]RDI83194.1 hypothetical protein Vi05172_g7041 [Venturia inaequalis]
MSATAKEDDITDNASSRRMRKRELDRRCQRVARERTKNRIAYLEGLVDHFQNSDSSGQVSTLMKQLSDIARDRDTLARTLQGIQNSIQSHQSLINGKEMTGKTSSSSPRQCSESLERFDDEDAVDPVMSFPPHRGEDSLSLTIAVDTKLPSKYRPVQKKPLLMQRHELPIQSPNADAFDPSKAFISGGITENHGILQDPIIPRTVAGCECSDGRRGEQTINMWRFANEVLTEPARTDADLERFEDVMEEDAPVRALIEGWPAVEKLYGGVLPPTWAKLRRIDEVVFGTCNVRERLAILRVMHKLMRYHTNFQKKSSVPAWYLKRPSQTIAHSYAIDYFAWPGLRERFVFYQHNYCSNVFWQLFCKSFRILWPFEFRDCYTRNLETGQYQISPQFDERIGDINAWTMSGEIFKKWPEFHSDIPSFNFIPASMSNSMKQMVPPIRSTMLDSITDDRRDDAGQEEISPMFLDSWNTTAPFASSPAKALNFIGIPQYMEYPGLSNVSY